MAGVDQQPASEDKAELAYDVSDREKSRLKPGTASNAKKTPLFTPLRIRCTSNIQYARKYNSDDPARQAC
jgi:hypothetical protein